MNEDKSVRYHRLKRRAAVLGVGATAALLGLLAATGRAVDLERAVGGSGAGPSSAAVIALYVVALAFLNEVVSLPIAVYGGFLLEQRYLLSTESAATWARDHLKAFAIGLLIALAGAEFVFFTIRWFPSVWWLLSALSFLLATVAMAKLAPIVLLPLFYRFKRLERDALRARLEAVAARAGVPVLGVYEWGLGEKTRRANAALVGTGRTRRILISNTLLAQYSDDEVEVILAHEIGHHVNRDIAKGLAIEGLLLVAAFYAAAVVVERAAPATGIRTPANAAALPLLLLSGGAVSLMAAPLVNAISRSNERRADRFALDVTRRPAAFVSAMRRLAAQNLAEERPSAAVRWLFHTHPPIEQRIAAAKAFE